MNIELKELLALATSYFLAVSACYLFGFWGSFNVNILQFADLTDFAKLSIYPMMASLLFVFIGFLISQLLFSKHLPPGGGSQANISKFGFKYANYVLAIVAISALLIATLGTSPFRWLSVAPLISFFSIPLQHNNWVIDKIPAPRIRSTLLFLVLITPGLSFAYGNIHAELIKSNHPSNTIDVDRSKLSLVSTPENPVSLLGFVGETYILYESKSRQIIYIKQSDQWSLYVSPKGF